MKPKDYLALLEALIGDGRDEEALDLAARIGPDVASALSAEDFFRVSSMLEGAELAVSLTKERGSRSRM